MNRRSDEETHLRQRCKILARMISIPGIQEIFRLRMQKLSEEFRGDKNVRFVTLRRRSDGMDGDGVVPFETGDGSWKRSDDEMVSFSAEVWRSEAEHLHLNVLQPEVWPRGLGFRSEHLGDHVAAYPTSEAERRR